MGRAKAEERGCYYHRIEDNEERTVYRSSDSKKITVFNKATFEITYFNTDKESNGRQEEN